MRNCHGWQKSLRIPFLLAALTFVWFSGLESSRAQDLTWSPEAADGNWFTAGNWVLNNEGATAPPTAAESASVNGTAPATAVPAPNIGTPGAVANQLLIGATIGEGGVIAAAAGQVNVSGNGASLTLSGTDLTVGRSLEVVAGTLSVTNGGSLITSGTEVGAIEAGAQSVVEIEGAGSTWTENGTLDIGAGNTANVIVADGGSFRGAQPVTIESFNGTIQIGEGGAAGTFNAPSIVNNGEIVADFTDATTISAQISGEGEVDMDGPGVLTLTGNNSFAGEIFIDEGTIVAGATNALGSSFVQATGTTSTLQINAGTTQTNDVTLAGGATLNNFGTLIGPVEEGPTVVVFSDGTVNNAAGASIINASDVAIAGEVEEEGGPEESVGASQLRAAAIAPDPLVVTNAGMISGTTGIQVFDLVDGSITNASTGTIIGTAGTAIDGTQGGTVTLSNAGIIRGNVLLAAFPNTVTLITGGQIVGDLNLGDATEASLILDGTGASNLSQAVTGAITNFNSLTKQNTGTWTIDEALTYSGGTNINGGTLVAGVNNAFGSGLVSANGSGVLQVNAGITVQNFIQLNNGGSLVNGGVVGVSGDGSSLTAAITAAGGATITNNRGATITGTGLIGIQSASGSTTVTNAGSISGIQGVELNGGGTVTNNATGVVTGSSGTAVSMAGNNAMLSNSGLISGNVALNALSNSVQLFSGSRIAGSLALSSSGTNQLILDGAGTATISQAVTGSITNAGTLIKQGSGTWVIDTPTSAPTGTDVNLGTLQVDSRLATAVLMVQQGATLKGSGVIDLAGGTVVNAGMLAPGDSPGTLTLIGNFTQTSSGTFNVLILSPTEFDRLNVTGHASLAGTLKLTLGSGYIPAPGTQFTILTAAGGISGTFQKIVTSGGGNFGVTYKNGVVQIVASSPAKIEPTIFHFSDGTPSSTTALMADAMFYDFTSLSTEMAESGKANSIGVSFDGGTFTYQGHHGDQYGFPISGEFKVSDRSNLDYQIPLQYLEIANTATFQSGLTLSLPTRLIIATPDQPFSWDTSPAVGVAASGSREIIGAGALTNVFAYRFPGFTLTYGNYISFFDGDVMSDDDEQFPVGVDQSILKNGLKLTVPFGKGWIVQCYGIYTEFLRTAAVSSYVTVGFELGRHFVWNVEGKDVDLGYLSFGLYTEQGNRYSSGHFRVGSAWRF